jgi:hypothetical protein
MRIRRFVALCSVLVAALPAAAGAQEQHKVGVTMGYPASFGALWHVSDKVALRPELSFGGSSTDTTGSSIDISGNGWSVGTGVSALFYLGKKDRLRTYVSPRFTYGHSSSHSSLSSVIPVTPVTTTPVTTSDLTSTSKSTGFSGSFGAQFAVGDRFTVFGEVGLGYAHSWMKSSQTPTSGSGNSWGTRTGVGVVFYP